MNMFPAQSQFTIDCQFMTALVMCVRNFYPCLTTGPNLKWLFESTKLVYHYIELCTNKNPGK